MRTVRCSSRLLGGIFPSACWDTPPWTEWQTGVKTLPCRNYVADGKNNQIRTVQLRSSKKRKIKQNKSNKFRKNSIIQSISNKAVDKSWQISRTKNKLSLPARIHILRWLHEVNSDNDADINCATIFWISNSFFVFTGLLMKSINLKSKRGRLIKCYASNSQ